MRPLRHCHALHIQRLRNTLLRQAGEIRVIAAQIGDKEVTAVRITQHGSPEVAALICQELGIKYNQYRQYLGTYKTERDLLNVIERAEVDDSPLLRFCRAARAVIHNTHVGTRRREVTDPVLLAKMSVGTWTPPRPCDLSDG
jgi:hypothetical protein